MQKLIGTARRLQKVCEDAGHRFSLIGGLVVQRWGQTRVTEDVDATIYTGFGGETAVIEHLLGIYQPRRPDAAVFAELARVLLLNDPKNGIGIDIAMAALDFESRVVERSSLFLYRKGAELRTCSAEDLIVYKGLANRDLDWIDIKGVLIRQQGKLDFALIEAELWPLVELKEEPEIVERWELLKQRYP